MAREAVAALRMEAGRHPDDSSLQALVGELVIRDGDFRNWWGAASVSAPNLRRKIYRHPLVGELALDAHMLAVEGQLGLTLVTYTAQPGSRSEDALRCLLQWNGEPGEGPPG